ncbi:MAG: CBS domain-containing protein [Actinomycetota bacterium]|nr:CBS domain-containing protein [Actinomycetota bacterium]
MAGLVREVMTPDPVTVTRETGVEELVRLLGENDLPGVPVVDASGHCVGMVTESDLVMTDEDGEDLHIPHYIELFGGLIPLEPLRKFEERLKKAAAASVADMMTAPAVTVEADDPVRKAARLIAESGHNRLPVEDGGRLVGIVTRADVLRAITTE